MLYPKRSNKSLQKLSHRIRVMHDEEIYSWQSLGTLRIKMTIQQKLNHLSYTYYAQFMITLV
jgi:hypothetical protein